MGRHVNGDAVADDPIGGASETGARHSTAGAHAQRWDGRSLDATVISPDTHVGTDFEVVEPGTPDAAPSPARPDELVQNGRVGDGHELE